jgi:hypothetical protein
MAEKLPCTAAALLHLLLDQSQSPAQDGIFYLDGIPSVEVLNGLLEPGNPDRELQPNPYSGNPLLIEVRWWVRSGRGGTRLVALRMQMVRRQDGLPIAPAHLVEPPAVVLVSDQEIRLLPVGRRNGWISM